MSTNKNLEPHSELSSAPDRPLLPGRGRGCGTRARTPFWEKQLVFAGMGLLGAWALSKPLRLLGWAVFAILVATNALMLLQM